MTATDGDGEVTPPATHFARMEMRGERFDGGRLPITSLVELERYRDLIIAAAKERWTAAHPDDELPADFEAKFQLDLVEVHNGSAISELEVTESEYTEVYVAAREDVDRAFHSIVTNEFAPDAHGGWVANEDFWNFGDTLGTTESITVRESEEAEPRAVIYGATRESRFRHARELATPAAPSVEAPSPRIEDGQVAGRLIAINAEAKSFQVKALLYGRVSGKYTDAELTADLKDVLDSSARAPVVRVEGRLRFLEDTLLSIVEAKSVELLEIDAEPWSRRFVELATLRPGWLDGEEAGQAVVFAAIDAARELLSWAAELGRDEPGIFPMEDGGILLEWAELSELASVEISPELLFHVFHTRRDAGVSESQTVHSISEVKEFIERAVPR